MLHRLQSRLRRPRAANVSASRRKQLATELRDSRKMLEEIQRIARIGSWEFDLVRRVACWSNEISRIFEVVQPAGTTAYKIFARRIHREDRDRVAQAYADAARQDTSTVIDYRLQFPDGRVKDVRERREIRRAADGRPLRVSGTVQDITEYKLAEIMFESEKSRLRTFIDTIPDLVWIKDPDGIYLACNPVFERFFGAKEAEIAGKSDFDFVDAELAAFFRQKDREAIAAGRSCVNEKWVRFAHDGRCALLETIRTPFYDDRGNVSGILCIARDITERKHMEERLYLREQEFRTIAENSPDPIARYDTECRCIYVNPALERVIGKDVASCLGKTPLESADGLEALRPYEEKIREALRTGHETELELVGASFPGGCRPLCDHIRFTPEFDRDRRVLSVLAVGRDIAKLKEIERSLSHSRTLLQTLVARQEKEREAERKRVAWEVHEELGQLLAVLRMHFMLMHDRLDDGSPQQQGEFRSTITLFDRAVHVVRDLAASLWPSVLDLGIHSALEWLAGEFTKRTAIPCTLDCPAAVALNEECAIVIFRVAEEALDNIARHAQAQTIDIILARRDDDVVLEVRDDGKGFDPDMPKEKKLGLLRVQERARMVGGVVAVRTALGQGTVVELSISIL